METATRFPLDARTMRVEFVASLGPLRVRGAFAQATGVLDLPDSDISHASIEVVVASASVDTGLVMRDRHLRGASFLDAAAHPHITFASHQIRRVGGDLAMDGRLVLRGIARDVSADCEVHHADTGGLDGAIALGGSLDLDPRDYGVAIPRGFDLLNPIFLMMGRRVLVTVRLTIPARRLLPALLPALGR